MIPSMTAKLVLHVHEHPEGRVIVTPVDFPRLSVDADTYEAAHAAATSRITRQLRNVSGSVRNGLSAPVDAELDVAEVTLPRAAKGAGKAKIVVSLVVTLRSTSQGELFVVRAPEVPDFEIAVTDRDQVRPSAEAGLREELAHWGVSAILSCDLVGRVWLEELEVPFPPASDMEESTDDSFELEGAGDDLTLLAAEDRLGRFDRRDDLLERIVAVLASPGRSSVILVGPPDVGKSALVHELASRVASGRIPPALQGRPLWRLSANELIAGARFTGMWQDRARLLVARGRAERVIFVMGDPTAIVDAGRWNESENNLARFLRTHVESGDLTLICEATPETFGAAQAKEPSFIDAFYRVDVPQPAVDVAREIVAVAAKRLEAAQSASVSSDAVDAAVELTVRFEPYRGLPGKAVRLLQEASQHASTAGGALVTRETVVTSFAARGGLPLFLLSDEIPMSVEQTLSFFEDRVLGQAEAVTAMVDLLAVAKAGLNDPSKPLGTFFFVGPTGVGKTELSKALAEFLFGSRDRVIRFDMGEFASADAVQRLVGTAWSRDREGELTRRVREQPFCVVLLDEIEKAHSSVYPALLAALGEGRMTDANGRTADFRSSIIIMTSNLGAARRGSQSVGFTSEGGAGQEADRLKRHFVEQAERFFQPEFFNRIDHLIAFHELSEATVRKIARRELGRLLLREGIARRRLLVEVDDRVVDRLAVNGFHPEYGARPLQREIERAVIQPLARVIVEDRAGPGDLVRFVCQGDEIAADLRKVVAATRPTPPVRQVEDRQAASLSRAEHQAQELLGRLATENDTEITRGLRGEQSRLVEQTNLPGFWDEPDSARSVLERLYQIQQALERLDRVCRRADGLHELARQIKKKRDRTRLPELRQALAELEEELVVIRLEIAGASVGPDHGGALVRVVPVGTADGWAETLIEMYAAWADRTGRLLERSADHPNALQIQGLSTSDLLLAEAGLHKRIQGNVVSLARVIVESAISPSAATVDEGDAGETVRIYSEGRRQFVRDPRTGVSVGDVSSVLRSGRIDSFLVAGVRHHPGRAKLS